MSITLWKSIVDTLRDEIIAGNTRIGDRFLSRNEVCSRFEVSAITAKRALDELEREGWIKKYKYRGALIARNHTPVSVSFVLPYSCGYNNASSEISDLSSFPLLMRIVNEFQGAANAYGISLQFLRQIHIADFSGHNLILFQGDDLSRDIIRSVCLKNNVVITHSASEVKHASTVCLDIGKGADLATKHLVSCGHKRIALILKKITSPWQVPRFVAYEKVLRRNKITFDWQLVQEIVDFTQADIWFMMDRLMSLDDPPTAIFAGNDEIALIIMRYCRERGICIPGRLSIIGFDNSFDGSLVSPGLTTVDTGIDLMAKETLRIALDENHGQKKEQNVTIPPKLILRESTALSADTT